MSRLNNDIILKYFWIISIIPLTKGNNTNEEAWQNEMFKLPDLKDICQHYKEVDLITISCTEQLNIVCRNITLLSTMLHASSKFPFTGLGYASKMDFGNFDQCMTVDHTYEGGRILGEYCREGLVVPDASGNISDADTYFTLSVCRPDACNGDDYNAVIENLIKANSVEVFLDDKCQTARPSELLNTTEIVTLTTFGIIIWIIVISTTYDIYLYKNQFKNVHSLFTTFSMLSNGRKLLHISKHPTSREQIETFHGLRVISLMWIVAGHGFMAWLKVPIINKEEWGDSWTKHLYAGYIVTAPLAVDTFFFMSGFLVAFQYLRFKEESLIDQLLIVPQMYIHRYIRITPALLMVYLVTISFITRVGSGPLWEKMTTTAQTCKENWWAFLLYIQNYYNYDNFCLPQTWFLSALMQLFLLSPLILIPISLILRKPSGLKKSIGVLLALIFFSTVMPIAHKFYFPGYLNDFDTHSRLIDYSIGMTLGVFMRETIDKSFLYMTKEHNRSVLNLVMWTLILLWMLSTVICFQLVEIFGKYKIQIVFYSLMRPAWCIGLSWIVYSCYHGYGGFVNWILCRPIFQVLGRLTYCIYLVHQSIIDYYVSSTRAPWYFTDYNAFYLFCGHYLASIIVAIFWSLAFESPLIVIEKYLIQTGSCTIGKKLNLLQNGGTEEAHLKNIALNGVAENSSTRDADPEGLHKKINEPL